jgi:hypothetical protein
MKTAAEKRADTNQQRREGHEAQIRDTVFNRYVETKEGMTIKDIAAAMAMNESWVRRYIHDPKRGGATPKGIEWTSEWRTTYSKDYPSMEAGVAQVRVYEPTKAYIVEQYTAMRNMV